MVEIFRCKIPVENLSKTDTFAALPKTRIDHRHSRCTLYDANYANLTHADLLDLQNATFPEVSCRYGFEFDRSSYQDSIVTDFGLVCDQHLLATASFTFFTLGGMFGPIIWGIIADRDGRKKGFYACVTFQSIFSVATGFAPNYTTYCILRLLVGTKPAITIAINC